VKEITRKANYLRNDQSTPETKDLHTRRVKDVRKMVAEEV